MSRDPEQVLRRSIGIVFADGGLLTLSGTALAGGRRRPRRRAAAGGPLRPRRGPRSTFEEALLSTEYGEDGVQRRATLELWLDAEDGRRCAAPAR